MIDITETYRELQAEILNIYLTSTSNRMNEIMKVLTIIATIFIPLSFVAGIYGMNFAHMPELQNRYAYFIVLSAMVAAGLIMLTIFWRKGWLDRSNTPPSNKRKKARREDVD
jgi:magnesium transporter